MGTDNYNKGDDDEAQNERPALAVERSGIHDDEEAGTAMSEVFIDALRREVQAKAELYNDTDRRHDPYKLLAWVTEEVGEVATALTRHRTHAAIAECVDVAHAALRLAVALDRDGTVLPSLFMDDWRDSAADYWRETHTDDPPWEH